PRLPWRRAQDLDLRASAEDLQYLQEAVDQLGSGQALTLAQRRQVLIVACPPDLSAEVPQLSLPTLIHRRGGVAAHLRGDDIHNNPSVAGTALAPSRTDHIDGLPAPSPHPRQLTLRNRRQHRVHRPPPTGPARTLDQRGPT